MTIKNIQKIIFEDIEFLLNVSLIQKIDLVL